MKFLHVSAFPPGTPKKRPSIGALTPELPFQSKSTVLEPIERHRKSKHWIPHSFSTSTSFDQTLSKRDIKIKKMEKWSHQPELPIIKDRGILHRSSSPLKSISPTKTPLKLLYLWNNHTRQEKPPSSKADLHTNSHTRTGSNYQCLCQLECTINNLSHHITSYFNALPHHIYECLEKVSYCISVFPPP